MGFNHWSRARALRTTALVAFGAVTFSVTISQAANAAGAANTTSADVNVLNLLSPFLNLPATQIGQTTLSLNLSKALATNAYAAANPTIEAVSISDKTIFNAASTSITLANNKVVKLGPGANLAGGLPVQAVQSAGGIAPAQAIGGLGALGTAFQNAVAPTGGTAPAAATLLINAYNFTSTNLGIAKFYFANGTTNGAATAIAPDGSTLPTADGLPNITSSVYDIAYGVTNTGANQNTFGDSRPVQVDSTGVIGYDPTALTGLAGNPSFPSGHTTYGYTDSILIGMLAPQFYQSMVLRASEYGNSRISLGVHYPLDIIASRSFVQYELAQLLNGNAGYTNTDTPGSTTALSLASLFTAAQPQLTSALGGSAVIATDAAANSYNAYSLATYATQTESAGEPAATSNSAIYDYRMNYGLPTLSYAVAPREQAPADGPDASILLATVFGGGSAAGKTLAPSGGIYGSLATDTINQILVNTEAPALAAFYGTDLSYWSRIDLYDAIGYFGGVTGTLTLAPSDQVTTDVTIADTGILRGTGTIGTALANNDVEVQSGGTIYPGSAAAGTGGTLAVNGNASFDTGSVLEARGFVNPDGTVSNDQLNVSGNLAVAGGSTVKLDGVFLPGKVYDLVTVGGTLTGTFASASTGLMSLINTPLFYAADPVVYTVPQADFVAAATNGNQRAVANALDNAANAGSYDATGALALNALIAGTTVASAPATFSALSGEIIADQQQAGIDAATQFASTVLGQANGISGAPTTHNHVWISGFGAHQEQDGSSSTGSAKQNTGVTGFAAGADMQLTPDTLVGVAAGYTTASFTATQRNSNGAIDGGDVGLYGRQNFGAFYAAGTADYAHYNNTTNRYAAGVGGTGRQTGEFDSNTAIVRVEGGYKYAAGFANLTPFAGFQLVSLANGSVTEGGIGGTAVLGLTAQSKTVTSKQTSLGMQFDTAVALGNGGAVTPFARIAWGHEFDTRRSASVELQALPSSFTVVGAAAAENAAQISGGLNAKLTSAITVYGTFGGEIASHANSYSGNGGVKIIW